MKTWITADHHLGENRFEIMQRPFKTQREMIDVMIERHNSVVASNDLVYFNGDVCYQKTPEFLPEVDKFNGNKILIRGNHDRVFTNDQLLQYFDGVVEEGQGLEGTFGGIPTYITHYPTCARHNKFNLVGHVHGAWKYQLNMVNIGVDCNHFYPHDIDVAVPFYFNAITNFYDDDCWIAYNDVNQRYLGKRGKQGSYFAPKMEFV